jgi:hypothetical protein
MYGFKKALLSIQGEIKKLSDPDETSQDPIYKNVILGQAENIGLYNGALASVIIATTPKTGAQGARRQAERAIIQGAVITYIPGVGTNSVLKCIHYSDIVGDWLETNNSTLIGKGISLEKNEDNTHNWRPVNVSETKTPKMCIAGSTKFILTKTKL